MGVEGVAGDEGSGELGEVFVEKATGGGLFAVVFFSAVAAQGDGGSGGLKAKGDDFSELSFAAEVFAVEGEGLGQGVLVGLEPAGEGVGEFDGVEAVDEVVEGIVSGEQETSAFFVPMGEADGAAMILGERAAFAPDRFDVGCAAEQAVGDEGEHGAEGVLATACIAMVVDVFEGVVQSTKFTRLHGTARSGDGFADGALMNRGKDAGTAKEGAGVFLEGADPEVLGALGILIEVTPVTPGSFGKAERGPVGDFVKGALVVLGVVEAFSKQGLVAVALVPLVREGAQGKSEALAGEIGRVTITEDEAKASKLDDEFEAIGPGDIVPVDPVITVLEPPCGGSPAEDREELRSAVGGVLPIDSLPEDMAHGSSIFEIVVLAKGLAKEGDLGRSGGSA